MENLNLTPDEELRAENEIKALKLDLEFNSHSYISGNAPPKVVSRFLDNVARFERANAQGRLVPVRRFARMPDFPPLLQVPDDKFEGLIRQILRRLQSAGIVIDRPEHLSPRGYYRFLTETFFNHLIVDYHAPGMIHGFNYSDFFEDGPEFIEEHVEETLLDLLHLGKPFSGQWISDICRSKDRMITKNEVFERIQSFRAQYSTIIPIAFQAGGIEYMPHGVYFLFNIAWEGHPAAGGDSRRFEGMGVCQVKLVERVWQVDGMLIPGFEF